LVLNPFDVVVMDEAGMGDSISMLSVLKIVKSARAKLVLIGDPAQLQPVGPGASFRALLERIGFVEIQTVYRQSQSWQQNATIDFAAGHIGKGLAAYQAHQAVHIEKTADAAMDSLVKDWLNHYTASKDLRQLLVIAHRNQDVDALNQKIRQARIFAGGIKTGFRVKTSRGEIQLAIGDRLLFLKNNRQLGLSNGRFATIKNIDVNLWGRIKRVSVILDNNYQTLTINPSEYADFTLGYAATVHKSQGITVDHAWVYAGGRGWNRHLTYVALSRHRQSCHLYADEATFGDFKTLQRQLGRQGLKDSVLDFPLAFAERRGFSLEGYLQRLQQHLLQSLTRLKSKLVDSIRNRTQTTQEENLEPSISCKASTDEISQDATASKKEILPSPTAKLSTINKSPTAKTPHYDIQRIRTDLNAQVESVVQRYLGEPKSRQGNTWRFGRNQGSLVVTVDGDKKGLWHDFQTNAGGDMLGLIKTCTNPPDFKTLLQETMKVLGDSGQYRQANVSAPLGKLATINTAHLKNEKPVQTSLNPAKVISDNHKPIVSPNSITQQKIQKAQTIAQNSQPIQGTLAEHYLRQHRGIQIPLLDNTFRFHPQLRHWMTGNDYPALLVIARDDKNEVCGLQAIFLDPETGNKANIINQSAKLSRGVIKGGAMVQQGGINGILALTEGPETALSVAQAHPDWTVYATFGISNFTQVALSLPAKKLVIAADNDGKYSDTQKSIDRAVQTISTQGRSVWITQPQKPAGQAKWDFNDALRQGGIEAVKKDLDQAVLYSAPVALAPVQKSIKTIPTDLPEKITFSGQNNSLQKNHHIDIKNSSVEVKRFTPATPQNNSTDDRAPKITLERVLTHYVEMELEQTRLIAIKHHAYLHDPKNAPEAAKQTARQAHHIQTFIKKAYQHPDVQTAIEGFKKTKPKSISDRGGFINIYERFKKGEWLKEDINVLVHQLQNKVIAQSFSYKQTQNSGRRKQ
jgi:phage/plasmid primase-like uncharacterized protein